MYYLKQKLKKAERKASLPDTMSRPAAIGNQRLSRRETRWIQWDRMQQRVTRQGALSSDETVKVGRLIVKR